MSARIRGINVHRFLEGFGVRCVPIHRATEPRPANVVYGGRIIHRMLRRKGEDHAGAVLAAIQASNATAFYGDVLFAVSLFIGAHRPQTPTKALREEFAAIDIAQLRAHALRLSVGEGGPMAGRAKTLATLIATELLTREAA